MAVDFIFELTYSTSMDKTKYTIQDTTMGRSVAGYSARHMCVQLTNHPALVRKFATPKAAQKWADKYSDAGYGLSSANVKIVPVPA